MTLSFAYLFSIDGRSHLDWLLIDKQNGEFRHGATLRSPVPSCFRQASFCGGSRVVLRRRRRSSMSCGVYYEPGEFRFPEHPLTVWRLPGFLRCVSLWLSSPYSYMRKNQRKRIGSWTRSKNFRPPLGDRESSAVLP